MTLSELFAGKTIARDEYKSTFSLPRRSKILIAVHFTGIEMTNNVLK